MLVTVVTVAGDSNGQLYKKAAAAGPKALGRETLKSGARATQQNADNKESYASIESKLQMLSLEENVSCLECAIEEEI